MTRTQNIAVGAALIVIGTVIIFQQTHRNNGGTDMYPTISAVVTIPATATVTPFATVRPSVAPVSARAAVLNALNARRSVSGVGLLTTKSALQAVAQAHASDMIAKGYFDHTSPSGVTFQQRINSSGYIGTAFAENLGLTAGAASDVVVGWMNSSGHRTNMLNAVYRAVGIGISTGIYQGRSTTFVVAIFGN